MRKPLDASEVTQLLRRWRDGDADALDALLPRVYDRLRAIASARLRGERTDHTLDTSALVHEAYFRLTEGVVADWQDRNHFFAVASTAMRRVLIDHAKQRQAAKRGGARVRVDLDQLQLSAAGTAVDVDPESLLALESALVKLEARHGRQAKALELRYFAGLTLEEAATVLGTSAPTVMRDLRFAEAWLARELTAESR
ncbi:MAG: ECF-type sigma factor [Gemmatimonadota bacterium]|nr:ECF-type sigma factor [Gemmatimonadota bacterium]